MPQAFVNIQNSVPAAIADGTTTTQIRADRLASPSTLQIGSGISNLAAEGTYFRACNPTMGTGIATNVTTSFSDSSAIAIIQNLANSGKSIYMDYLRLICTAAGTGATSFQIAIVLDPTNRYISGGTAVFGTNCNTGFSTFTNNAITFGAVSTTNTDVNYKRQASRLTLKTQAAPCMVVGDQYLINFAANESPSGPNGGAVAAQYGTNLGANCLASQSITHSLIVHAWWPGLSVAPSFEFEAGWWER